MADRCKFCISHECRKPGFVYVMGERGIYTGPVKVGYSIKPVRRLAVVRKRTRADIRLHHVYKTMCATIANLIELGAHARLSENRPGLSEWFNCSVEDAVTAIHLSAAEEDWEQE